MIFLVSTFFLATIGTFVLWFRQARRIAQLEDHFVELTLELREFFEDYEDAHSTLLTSKAVPKKEEMS